MYVCLCNAIKESEVRDLARAGARTADGIYAALGCEPHCSTCTEYLQQMIDAESAPLAAAVPA